MALHQPGYQGEEQYFASNAANGRELRCRMVAAHALHFNRQRSKAD